MQPSTDQLQRVQSALLAAFNYDTLRRMLKTGMDAELDHIAPRNGNDTDAVEAVVYHFARRKGGLHALIASALRAEPNSPAMIALNAELGSVEFDPLPRKSSPAQWALIAAAIVAATAFIVVVYNALREPPVTVVTPVMTIVPLPVTVVAPTPTTIVPLTGDLNIAVAQFGVLADGRVDATPEPNGLADTLFATLKVEAAPLITQSGFDVQWREPSIVRVIAGNNEQERSANAKAAAETHKADLLIYGYVSGDDVQTRLEPLLYVTSNRLVNAQEMAGQYAMGDRIPLDGDIKQNAVVSKEASSQLALRTGALARFAIGLGYFAVGRYDEAKPFLTAANERALATRQGGREAILLFLGSSAGKTGNLDAASHYYAQAIAENSEYARAQLGAAQTTFQLASNGCISGATDIPGVQAAVDGYEAAQAARIQPGEAEIPIKVAFYKGQAYICLTDAGAGDLYSEAQQQLQRVTTAYAESPKPQIRSFAAEAYALLGKVANTQSATATDDAARLMHLREAENSYRKAVELTQLADRKVLYSLRLAQIVSAQGAARCADARTHRQDAADFVQDFFDANPSASQAMFTAFMNEVAAELDRICPPPTPAP